jgi:hypothetical protein
MIGRATVVLADGIDRAAAAGDRVEEWFAV